MRSLIQRLVNGIFFSKPEKHPKRSVRPKPPAVSTLVTPNAEAMAPAHKALMGVGARRPVIAVTGEVVGYEFCIPLDVIGRLSLSSDQRAKSAYVASVVTSANLIGKAKKIGFARIPAQLIVLDMPLPACSGIWVGIESPQIPIPVDVDLELVAQYVRRLRAAGAKVGWSVTFVEIGKSNFGLLPDFALLHQGEAPISALLTARKAWPETLIAMPTLATDLCSEEDLESALRGGIDFVCGAFNLSRVAPEPPTRQPVPPDVVRLVSLMNSLLSDVELSTVVNDIKGDVGLSYRLLSMMKSAKYANLKVDPNVEQAVLTLGRDELYRIFAVMLMRYAGTRKVSSALEEIALWRSRLLELLAIDRGESAPGCFFTLGLVSMLGSIFKQELKAVVEKIAIPEPAKQALLEQDGPWYAYLLVAKEVEGQKLSSDSPLIAGFGDSERILELSNVAWDWAAEISKKK